MAVKFDLEANTQQIIKSLNDVNSKIDDLSRKMQAGGKTADQYFGEIDKGAQGASGSIKELIKQTAAFAGISLGAAGVAQFAKQIVTVRKEMQSLKTSFDTLLGSAEKSDKMFGELKQFAATTPLMLKDLAAGAQTMLGFNIEAEKVVPTLKAIGDISMGDSQRFQSLTLAFSQMSATGKLMGQDLLQMINAGFNPLTEISRKTGKSIADLKDEMSKGKISAEMVADAFRAATSEGGKFNGMLEKQGQTLAGQMNQLQGAIDDMFNKIGEQTEGVITGAVSAVQTLVVNYEKVGRILIELISIYGAYKAACIAVTTVEKFRAGQLKVLITLQQTLNRTMLANPYVAVATALVALTVATREYLLRESDLEKQNKRLNEELGKQKEALESSRKEAEKLIDLAADEKVSSKNRAIAIDELLKKYKGNEGIIQQYIEEEGHLTKIVELKERLAQIDLSTAASNAYQEASFYKLIANGDVKADDEIVEQYKKETDSWFATESSIRKWAEGKAKNANRRYEIASHQADLAKVSREIGLLPPDELNEALKRLKNEYDKMVAKNFGSVVFKPLKDMPEMRMSQSDIKAILDRFQQPQETKQTIYSEEAKKAFADWKKAKATYEALAKDQTATTEQVKAARDDMESKDTAYETVTGQKASAYQKQLEQDAKDREKAAKEARDNAKKWREMDAEIARESENERIEAEIDAMPEGTDKVIAQLQHEHERKIAEIEREKQETIDKANEVADKETRARIVANAEAIAEFKAQKADNDYQRKLPEAVMESELKTLRQDPAFIEAFKDLDNVADKTIAELLNRLEELKGSFADMPVDQLREITDLMQQMEDALIERDTNPLQQWRIATNELATAKVDEAKATAKVSDAQKKYDDAVKRGGKSSAEAIQAEKALADAKADELDAMNKTAKAQKKEARTREQLEAQISELAEAIKAVGEAIGGEAGEIIGFIGDIASFVTDSINNVKRMAAVGAQALSTIEKASAILAIIQMAIQLFQKLNDIMNKFGASAAYDKAVEKQRAINALADSVNEYTLAILKAQNAENSWFGDSSLRDLRNGAAEMAKVSENYYAKLYEDQVTYRNKSKNDNNWTNWWGTLAPVGWAAQLTSTAGLIDGFIGGRNNGMTKAIDNLRIETRSRKKSFMGIGGHDQKTQDLREWARQQYGDELFDTEGMVNVEMAEQILDDYGDKLQGETKATLEQLVELKKAYDEGVEQLRDYVSDAYSPLLDNMTDGIMDWLETGKDAMDSFEEYAADTFRNIVRDMLQTIVMDKVVGAFQDDIADVYAKFSKGEISQDELTKSIALQTAELADRYEKEIPVLQEIATGISDTLNNVSGIDITGQNGAQATQGIAASFSQDSIDEANGRMAALQMGQQQQSETMAAVSATLAAMGTSSLNAENHLADLVSLAGLRNQYVADIYERLGQMQVSIDTRLAAIADNTAGI